MSTTQELLAANERYDALRRDLGVLIDGWCSAYLLGKDTLDITEVIAAVRYVLEPA